MALINCPECGKQVSDRAQACPDCGCPINTPPLISVPNTADEVNKLLVLAHRARESGDSVNAKRYYDQILDKAPGNWEGIFYSVYYNATMCKIMNIASAAYSVANCILSTFYAISELDNDKEKDEALNSVVSSSVALAAVFVDSATSHFSAHSTADGARSECRTRVNAAHKIYVELEDNLKKLFPSKKEFIADFQLKFIKFLSANTAWIFSLDEMKRLREEVAFVCPEYARKLEIENEIKDLNKQIERGTAYEISKETCVSGAKRCFAGFALSIFAALLFIRVSVVSTIIFTIFGVIVGIIGFSMLSDSKKALTAKEIENKTHEREKQKSLLKEKRDNLQKELDSLLTKYR